MISGMMKRMAGIAAAAAMFCAIPVLAVDVDLSSPKATVTTLAKAMQEGDANAAKAAIDGDEQQMKAIDVMMQMLTSMQRMEKAAREKFGEEAAEQTADGLAEVVQQVDKAQVEVTGDTAVVIVPQGDDPAMSGPEQRLQLRKVGNDWKIDAAAFMPGEVPSDEQLKAVGSMANVADSIAKEIQEDKYETYDAAKAAYQQRIFAAMMEAMSQEQMPQPQGIPAE